MSPSWYSRAESRWSSRAQGDATRHTGHKNDQADQQALELRRVPTAAERVIRAPRSAVWAIANTDDEADAGMHQRIVGAPASGLGARHVDVGPPLPPFGMRSVMYTEMIALQEGHWYTTQTLAGSWEHTETLLLQDASDGQTLARVTGWWMRPAPRTADFTEAQARLNGLAATFLDRLAARAEATSTPGPLV